MFVQRLIRRCLPIALGLGLGAVSCAHSLIPGTKVEDTAENREVLQVVAKLRLAMEARDAAAVLALVSPNYFEDMGNPNPKDDYGYSDLQARVLPEIMATAKEIYVSFEANDAVVNGNEAYVDVRYNSRARIEFPSGSTWDTHKEFNRIEFTRENGEWRIISGL